MRIIKNDILEQTEELIKTFVANIKTAVRQAHNPERSRRAEKRQKQTFKVNIGFLKSNEIKLRSEASSLFDVGCWMFDVHLSKQPLFHHSTIPLFLPRETFSSFHWGHEWGQKSGLE